MRARNVLGALAAVPLLVSVSAPLAEAAEVATPANAVIGPLNDASVTEDKTTASYKDATDQLCVKVGSWSGANNWGMATILRPDGTAFKSILRNKNESGCTANLSIPEDATYYLQATDCIGSAGTCTLSAKVRFYS